MIVFNELEHSYHYEGVEFTSVTRLLKKLEVEKDWQSIAEKYAKKRGLTVEEVQAQWKAKNEASLTKGTNYHKMREDEAIAEGAYPILMEGNLKRAYDLSNLKAGTYPELIIYMPSHKVCGTSDIVKINEDRSFEILDFKGLALNTPIATSDGWKNIENICVGDSIFDGNGHLTKVKNVSNIHYNPCYKITFDTGETIVCDHEHRWVISKSKYNKEVIDHELTAEDLYKEFTNSKKSLLIRMVQIGNKEDQDINLPIDPYVLGLWLGDGNRTCGTITCVNDLIWQEIEKRGYQTSDDHNRNNDKATSKTIYGIRKKLVELNLIKNKHIPLIYLRSSFNQRLDLLRGYMDADGHLNKTRKRNVMVTTNKIQAQDLKNLCNSLGIKATIINSKTSGFGKKNVPTFHVSFTSEMNPFLIRNTDYNSVMKNKNFKESKYRYVKSIEKTVIVPTKCLEVESETHCYLAGYGMIKTHNTNAQLRSSGDMEAYFNPKTKRKEKEKLLSPVSHLYNCEIDKYTLQLSIYAYMLEEYNYTCNSLTLEHILFNEDDTYKESVFIPVPYLKKEAKSILNHFKNKL